MPDNSTAAAACESASGHHQLFGLRLARCQTREDQSRQGTRRRQVGPRCPQDLGGQIVEQFQDMERHALGVIADPPGGAAGQRPGTALLR
jgi:hypothetical protein